MITACDNKKGGVGKTTKAFHLAMFLAALGLRVLLLDLDSDRCLTDMLFGDFFEAHKQHKQTILDVLANPSAGIAGAVVPYDLSQITPALPPYLAQIPGAPTPRAGGKLDVITGSEELSDAPERFVRMCAHQPVGVFNAVLAWMLRQPMVTAHYDAVVIDIGPGWDEVTRAGLLAADYVVVPVEPASLSLDAFRRYRRRIEAANRMRGEAGIAGQTQLAGVLLSRVDPSLELHRQVAETLPRRLRDAGIPTFTAQIPVSNAILATPATHMPAWATHPANDASDLGPRRLVEATTEVYRLISR